MEKIKRKEDKNMAIEIYRPIEKIRITSVPQITTEEFKNAQNQIAIQDTWANIARQYDKRVGRALGRFIAACMKKVDPIDYQAQNAEIARRAFEMRGTVRFTSPEQFERFNNIVARSIATIAKR